MHVVYLTSGLTGQLNSGHELARRLAAGGHRVTYASHRDVRREVTAQGFSFVALGPEPSLQADEQLRPWLHGRLVRRLLHPRAFARERRAALLRYVAAADAVTDRVAELDPDLLLIEIEQHEAIVATARLGVPTTLLIPWFSIWKRPGLPPLHRSLVPNGSRRSRAAVELAWLAYRMRKRWQRARHRFLGFATDRVSALRTLARRSGFAFRDEVELDEWLIPLSYRRLTVLSMTAWETELPHVPRRDLHYVGPMVHRARTETAADGRARKLLEELVARRRAEPSRRIVYASLGTFWDVDRPFLARVFTAFTDRPEWDLVLGLGGKTDAAAFTSLPVNVHVLDWAPQLEVLRHSDGAITHGGIGTINECIWNEVPMLVYSTKMIDQNGCAARVAYHGLGIVGDKDRDDPAAIARNLQRVLDDGRYREANARIRRRFEEYEQENRAVHLLEQIGEHGR